MSIGKRIKEVKITLKMTSSDLANKLDIPVRTIGSYERDEAQPGPKFFIAMFEQLHVNVNWLVSGKGEMFIDKQTEIDANYITNLQERFNLSKEEINGLIKILDNEASKEMILKLIEIKKGNKEALDNLICNLQGIKAIYN